MVDGFFLNNQLTDFSFNPNDGHGRPAANAVALGSVRDHRWFHLLLLDRNGKLRRDWLPAAMP
jgi:gamma-glutamyltranspeptidase/glutathione hydrolase